MCARDPQPIVRGVDVRYTCAQCGTKWIVRGNRPVMEETLSCGACGGSLNLLDAGEPTGAPGWDSEPDAQRP